MVRQSALLTLLAIFFVHLVIIVGTTKSNKEESSTQSKSSKAPSKRWRRDSIKPNECYFANNQMVFYASNPSTVPFLKKSTYLPFVPGLPRQSSRFLETSVKSAFRPNDGVNVIFIKLSMTALEKKHIQNSFEFYRLIASTLVQNAYSKIYTVNYEVIVHDRSRIVSFAAEVVADFILTTNAAASGLAPDIINLVICRQSK